jgi:hypothetical protein
LFLDVVVRVIEADYLAVTRRPENVVVIQTRIRGVGSSNFFEISGVLKKESRSTGCTSHQADRHGYLPEVKIEIPEQMLDRINNSSARSTVT